MGDELRLRVRMIAAGLWLSALLLAVVGVWIAATWSRPHRGGLVAMASGAALATVVIALLPHERVVASRFREPFFLGWSLSLIVFVAAAAGLDAGVRSPMVLMLFLTLVYAALSYPRWAVAVVSAASLLAVLVLSQFAGGSGGAPTGPAYLVALMLALAVTGVMCIVQARIQDQARTELQRVARVDPLTGALNRLGFQERMSAELRRGEVDGASVALVLLDFDGFKAVNDRLGHAAGDELLCSAVTAMQSALRPGDALGRLGGDEFAALLPGAGVSAAGEVARRLQLALSPGASACVGSAVTDEDGVEAEDRVRRAEDLLHRADQRLYAAKRARRSDRRPPIALPRSASCPTRSSASSPTTA